MYKFWGRLTNSKTNLSLLKNIANTFIYKGIGIVLGILSMPLYMQYFNNNEVLGVWFTVINVLNWIMTLDLGIGNGLRNHLTIALSKGDKYEVQRLITSAYLMLGSIMGVITITFFIISDYIDWNNFFNVPEELIAQNVLRKCINITMSGILISFFLRLVTSINFALQKASRNNLITLITSILTFLYLVVVPSSGNSEIEFTNLSIYHAIVVNIPLLVATFIIFRHDQLKNVRLTFKYYHNQTAKKVLSLGVSFLFLQILFMIISVTNEWFISKFYNPAYCVDYQIYYKVFSFSGTLFLLGLAPLWSAITKAYAEQRYQWIIKLQKILYLLFIGLIIFQIAIAFLLPWIFKIWLQGRSIEVNYSIALWFIIYSVMFIWIAVQSTIVAGLGTLKIQSYCYLFAAAFKIIAIISMSSIFKSWGFIIAATTIGLLPYCIIQPISLSKQLNRLAQKTHS